MSFAFQQKKPSLSPHHSTLCGTFSLDPIIPMVTMFINIIQMKSHYAIAKIFFKKSIFKVCTNVTWGA
jgi:hypothetical protein